MSQFWGLEVGSLDFTTHTGLSAISVLTNTVIGNTSLSQSSGMHCSHYCELTPLVD